jgi:hypothetical protein
MATITPVTTTSAGTALSFAAASGGGDSLAVGLAGNKCVLHVRNGSGGSITVTLAGSIPCSQGSTHNTAITCAVGDTEIVVPSQCINQTTGAVAVTYSAVTSVTVAASYAN